MRYDLPDEKGENRRERNERFGVDEYSPSRIIPKEGQYLWDWFISLNGYVGRITEGICKPIPPTELVAWTIVTGSIVDNTEFDILHKMDQAFCEMMNKEMADFRSRRQEEAKAEAAKNTGRKGKR